MEKYIVDRFEENFVVLEREKGGTFDVDKSLLTGAKKGDIVIKKGGTYVIDNEETQKRRSVIMEKIRRLSDKR